MPENPGSSAASHSSKGRKAEVHGSKSGLILDEKVCCDLSLSCLRFAKWDLCGGPLPKPSAA